MSMDQNTVYLSGQMASDPEWTEDHVLIWVTVRTDEPTRRVELVPVRGEAGECVGHAESKDWRRHDRVYVLGSLRKRVYDATVDRNQMEVEARLIARQQRHHNVVELHERSI